MERFETLPLTGPLGTEIIGLDAAEPPDAETVDALRRVLVDRAVVVLRDQKLRPETLLAFARQLGEPEVHPIANGMPEHPEIIRVLKPVGEHAFFGTSWHSDNSFFETPSSFTLLFAEEAPPVGGDTLFASMEAALDRLSPTLRAFLTPLRAVHSASRAYDPRTTGEAKYRGETAITYRFSDAIYEEVEHPLVRTHPETHRQGLYVNPMFTQRIVGLNPGESDALLAFLYTHAVQPEFTCRVRWQPGTLVIWDNRSLQHYAIDDYAEYERLLYRVTLAGEHPV